MCSSDLNEDRARTAFSPHVKRFSHVWDIDQIRVPQCFCAGPKSVSPGPAVKNSARQSAAGRRRPALANALFELVVKLRKTNRTSDEQALKSELLFRERQVAHERVDDVKAGGVFPNESGRLVGEGELAKKRFRAGTGLVRKCVGETENFDDVSAGAPLFGQLHVNARRPEPNIPGMADDHKNAKRLIAVHGRKGWRVSAVQNLCRTGLT